MHETEEASAEGMRIEVPKAPRGVESGRGLTRPLSYPPQSTRGFGEVGVD